MMTQMRAVQVTNSQLAVLAHSPRSLLAGWTLAGRVKGRRETGSCCCCLRGGSSGGLAGGRSRCGSCGTGLGRILSRIEGLSFRRALTRGEPQARLLTSGCQWARTLHDEGEASRGETCLRRHFRLLVGRLDSGYRGGTPERVLPVACGWSGLRLLAE